MYTGIGSACRRDFDGFLEQTRECLLEYTRDGSTDGLILETEKRRAVVLDDTANRFYAVTASRFGTGRFSSRSKRSGQFRTSLRSGANWLRRFRKYSDSSPSGSFATQS